MILFTLITPMLYLPTARAADPSDWYTTLNGVLTTDSYLLYPYAEQSVDIGLSKYGEMINGSDPSPDVGLQYPGYDAVGTYDQTADTSRDPFANEYIDKELWLNGWVCDVRYTHRTWDDRRVLTMAMFADMTGYGGDWINGHGYTTAGGHTYNLALAPHGGRKSTGIATTEPLMVLYDGPRRYIALSNTTIYDWEDTNANEIVDEEDASWPILRIRLTFIFNKVKKQVIILKDIKILISGKELLSPLDVQFSNREEWDLGPPPNADESYAHFWHQNMTTCYGREWHMAPALMREYIVEGTPI
ncbi:MAG: hypothetical protein GWN86_31075, partial [Desulfobacterales bacterium]|nr:hypothetical protein [Desulfobacterales bacterium]